MLQEHYHMTEGQVVTAVCEGTELIGQKWDKEKISYTWFNLYILCICIDEASLKYLEAGQHELETEG